MKDKLEALLHKSFVDFSGYNENRQGRWPIDDGVALSNWNKEMYEKYGCRFSYAEKNRPVSEEPVPSLDVVHEEKEGFVIVPHPLDGFIMVPTDIAEKAVILGYLP
jgi:hypothetical protein